MVVSRLLALAVLLSVSLTLSSCTGAEPYVYKAEEFNRDHETFNRELTDRADVGICHNKYSTTADALRAMAQDECGRFQKTAVFVEHEYGDCPMLVPAKARFLCIRR